MALFVVRHQHPAEQCPARDPQMGNMLLNHLSEENASRHGLKIHGEAVIDGQHTLYLILEADDRSKVEGFMQPFTMAGTVEVWPASPCVEVVRRRGCG
jgi:hypothetical protein